VQLLAALAARGYEVRVLELRQMLGDSLARHGEPFAELDQRLAVALMQPVEQQAAARVGKGAENSVVVHVDNR
jgi:hypothetical protein